MSSKNVAILGGGQLGRMLGLAGVPLGLQCRFLDPNPNAGAAQVGELLVGAYDDEAQLTKLCESAEVCTYEFENVPASVANFVEQRRPIFPPPKALEVAQDRKKERELFAELGIPTPPWVHIDTETELAAAAASRPLPALLKARRFGYDGKGQFLLCDQAEVGRAFAAIGKVPALLDGFVDFEREVSILACRGREVNGGNELAFYPLTHNIHRGGILRVSRAPETGVSDELQALAQDYATRVLEALDYVGVLAMEFFVVRGQDGKEMLMANEIAPRVHNSGHWTIEGAETSQFENHLRAVTGLPLGPCEAVGASAMVNIVGDLPSTEAVLSIPGAHLHLYGKEPRPLRKIGHVTLRGETAEAVDLLLERFTRIIG